MVRDSRIKTYTFSPIVANSSGTNSSTSSYSDHVINGQIVSVAWSYDLTGSLTLSTSGASITEEVFRRNAPSGTGYQFGYPAHFTESTTGSIANATHDYFKVNDILRLNLAGHISGATNANCTIRYI